MNRMDRNTYILMYAYGGATNWNDYASYNGLTTPIAYLSSTAATYDPFANRQKRSELANTYDQQFEYTPRGYGHGTELPAAANFPADMYLLEGVGPDAVDSIGGSPNYPNKPSTFIPYDSSNGLRSMGDIFRTGRRFYARLDTGKEGVLSEILSPHHRPRLYVAAKPSDVTLADQPVAGGVDGGGVTGDGMPLHAVGAAVGAVTGYAVSGIVDCVHGGGDRSTALAQLPL